MRWTCIALVLALIIQGGYAPCLAQQITEGDEIDRSKLKVGAYVCVVYLSSKGRQIVSEGYIKAVGDTTLTVGRGFWKEQIVYRDILSFTMGDNAQDIAQLVKRQKEQVVQREPGIQVRIHAPSVSKHRLVGMVATLDADTLMLASKKQAVPLAIPRASVKKLEVSAGMKSRTVESAAVGFGFGIILGAMALASVCMAYDAGIGETLNSDTRQIVVGGIALGGGGGLMGAAIGSQLTTDRWEKVPTNRIRLGTSPQRTGGLGLLASVAF